ncbi:MAG: choice-of-anchor D domain-containing protein, partial [Terriglobales bacterium]
SLFVDANGDAFVYSQSSGGPADSLVNPIEPYTNGQDVFIQEIDPMGWTLLFSTFLGGTEDDFPAGIAVDPAGNVYVTGYTDSSDYPVTATAFQSTLAGFANTFVSKIATNAAPAVSLSPSSIQFGSLPVGVASQPSTVLLRNMGSAPLTISSIGITGDFSETDNCSPGVAADGSCTLAVTFTPTQTGTRSGSITIQDNAAGSPHSVALAGTGAATPLVGLTPASLTFPSLVVNQTSARQTVTLTNEGNAVLNISNIAVTNEYAQTNNCPASLAVWSSCQIQVTFTPTSGGAQNGSLSIVDNAPLSPQSVTLAGNGVDFFMPASGGSNTISAGATATYQFSISSVGGTFPGSISIVCADLPAFSTCNISPMSVTPGNNPVSVSVTIKTASSNAQLFAPETGPHPIFATWSLTSGFGLFGMFLFGATQGRKRTKRTWRFLLLFCLLAGVLFCASCGTIASSSHGGKPTPAGTYTVLVTGSSGSVQHVTSLSLTVQ